MGKSVTTRPKALVMVASFIALPLQVSARLISDYLFHTGNTTREGYAAPHSLSAFGDEVQSVNSDEVNLVMRDERHAEMQRACRDPGIRR